MLKSILTAALVCAVASPAFAQTAKKQKHLHPKPQISQAQADTLSMNCAQAVAAVAAKDGVILKTGSNHFDLYFKTAAACYTEDETSVPAFVRTKDNNVCHIGYTCEDSSPSGDGGN